MKTHHVLLCLLLLAGCKGERDGQVRNIRLTYLRPEEAARLVAPQLSDNMSISMSRDSDAIPGLRVGGPDAEVDRIAALIRRLDKPANVQLRFQLIEADGFTNADSAIADVQAALRDVFRFRGYRLVGESLVQGQAPGRVAQQILGPDGAPFQIEAMLDRVLQDDSARAVSMQVELRGRDALLATSLTVPSGKTVVVGTARARRDGNTLILVVRPRIE